MQVALSSVIDLLSILSIYCDIYPKCFFVRWFLSALLPISFLHKSAIMATMLKKTNKKSLVESRTFKPLNIFKGSYRDVERLFSCCRCSFMLMLLLVYLGI